MFEHLQQIMHTRRGNCGIEIVWSPSGAAVAAACCCVLKTARVSSASLKPNSPVANGSAKSVQNAPSRPPAGSNLACGSPGRDIELSVMLSGKLARRPLSWRGRVEIVSAAYPGQPFSNAGRRKGAADPRYLQTIMRRHCYPRKKR